MTDRICRSFLFASLGYHCQVTFQIFGPYLPVSILTPRLHCGGVMCRFMRGQERQMGKW